MGCLSSPYFVWLPPGCSEWGLPQSWFKRSYGVWRQADSVRGAQIGPTCLMALRAEVRLRATNQSVVIFRSAIRT
ncbi:hypothetical protein BQ8482_70085 [Mesorhizobium delmotii]|uniref:Uncharacterized protein n=1 Tax=Mesorhizobium delmotii TaxID=1631247 RepID=A0A2P9AW71_9HYPH|nr:hypothetical protein BQ8482_70085 [Mesorhizobium delmotii]